MSCLLVASKVLDHVDFVASPLGFAISQRPRHACNQICRHLPYSSCTHVKAGHRDMSLFVGLHPAPHQSLHLMHATCLAFARCHGKRSGCEQDSWHVCDASKRYMTEEYFR